MEKRSVRVRIFLLTGAVLFLVAGVTSYFLAHNPISEYPAQMGQRLSEVVREMEGTVTPLLDDLSMDDIPYSRLPMSDDLFSYYIYEDGEPVFWSDYRFVPAYEQVEGNYDLDYRETLRHDLIVRRWQVPGTNREVVGVIILYSRYKIDNNYLHPGWNDKLFRRELLQSEAGEESYPVCVQGECLFEVSVADQPTFEIRSYGLMAVIMIFLALSLLMIALVNLCYRLRPVSGLWLLLGSILTVRSLMLFVGFPSRITDLVLFAPRNFASSVINPSLGDLFLNLLLAMILVLYIFQRYEELGIRQRLEKMRAAWLAGLIISGFMAMALHFQYLFLQTIYNNSQISYDINQSLSFDILRLTGIAIFLVNAVTFFLGFHVLYKMLNTLFSGIRVYLVFAGGLLLFALINLLVGQSFLISIGVAVGYFLFIHLTVLPANTSRISYGTFMYVFTALVATSVLGSLTTHHFEHIEEREKKARFASQFLIENDLLAEYLLAEARENIQSDIFIQSRMSSPFMTKDIIRQKIRQVYLSNYFDKYDVQIYLYNANGAPFGSDVPQITPESMVGWSDTELATSYEDIYFINRLQGDISKRYLTQVGIYRRNILTGYVIIDMQLKKFIPDNVYPELLVDNRFLSPYEHTAYSYAVLDDRRITYSSGEFNYYNDFSPSLLESEDLYEEGITFSGYDHLALQDRRGRTVIISSREHPEIHQVSNFSFLFLVQVLILLLLMVIYAASIWSRKVELNYSARIQLYLNGAFFLPLIAVSVTTLSVINSSFRKELTTEYYNTAENISENISDALNDYVRNLTVDQEELPNRLAEVANYADVDVNLFNTRGRWLASTQPLIYENGLLSRYINPRALLEITIRNENFLVVSESVGELDFNTVFFGIKSFDTGSLIGIISIPFFQSAYELEQNQIDVLTNVINIFTVIFIIFLLISSVVSQWLTFPLKFITQKLKKTTLTGFNEPLTWNSDDEIGLMVREYNRMLINLEESKKALARNQKESAWREIAQQVAHEIKNPLTPMKLTLQHLSRKIKGAGGEGEEYQKPINSLLNQVDILSDIASSFSSFAKLPIPEHERYELTRVIRETIVLFRADQRADIRTEIPERHLFTMGDEQLMGRILSNILLNALQSSNGAVRIDVVLQEIGEARLVLEVRDNGTGIDESIHGKIFMPNFTTKDTGSGIGLAVAKHGIEHAGGKIWFETEPGLGTSFFIELPKVP